jgi:hypothetical protein
MRDPRPGFAKGQGCNHRRSAARRLGECVVSLTLCACGGAAGSSAPGGVSAPSAARPAAPVAARSRIVSLSYAAPAGCPDVDGYASHVRTRSSTLTLEPIGVAAPDSVDVKVDPAPDTSGWVGRVTIVGAQALDREVRGERCEDVVAALALITVLRLEGADASAKPAEPAGSTANGASTSGAAAADAAATASARAGESSASQPGTPPVAGENPTPAAPSRAANESDPSAGAAASEESPAPEAAERLEPAPSESAASNEQRATIRAREERRAESQARAERRALDEAREATEGSGPDAARASRASTESVLEASPSGSDDDASLAEHQSAVASEPWQWPTLSVGAAAQVGYASVPANAFRGLLQGELRLGEGMSSWATTLSFAYARGTSEVEVAKLGITLVTAELALCPPAFIDATRVWLRACTGVRGGRVHFVVTANDPDQDPAAAWRPWLAVGPSLQLGAPLGGRWALRGVFDLAVQLVRDRFNIERQVEVLGTQEQLTLYRPEAISFELGLALGYTF